MLIDYFPDIKECLGYIWKSKHILSYDGIVTLYMLGEFSGPWIGIGGFVFNF